MIMYIMADTFNAELVYNLMKDYNGGKDLFTTPYADFVENKTPSGTAVPKPFNDGLARGIVMYENHAVKVDVKPNPGLYLNTVEFENGTYEDAVRAIDRTNMDYFNGFDFGYDALDEDRYERKRKALMESEALLSYAKERDDWREQERRIAFTEYGVTPDEYEEMNARAKVESAIKLFNSGKKNAMGFKAKLEEVVAEGREEMAKKPGRPTLNVEEVISRMRSGADYDSKIFSKRKLKETADALRINVAGIRDAEEMYSIIRGRLPAEE